MARDGLLSALISLAEEGIEFGVTLIVQGVVITGRLVGEEKFQKAFGTTIGEAVRKSFGATNHDAASESLAESKVAKTAEKVVPAEGEPQSEYLHIVSWKILSGTRFASETGHIWRVRIDDVSGFMLGEVS